MDNMKTCNKCGIEKLGTPENFYVNQTYKCKLMPSCIPCTSANAKKYRDLNKERINKSRIEKNEIYRKTMPRKYTIYKFASKKRNLTFDLTFEEFSTFWKKPCNYCTLEIETIGLDRVDSSKGYTLNNVVSCCPTCNYMKRHHSLENFLSHISKIYNHALANVPPQRSLPVDNLMPRKPVPLVDQFQPLCVWSSSQSLSLMYND